MLPRVVVILALGTLSFEAISPASVAARSRAQSLTERIVFAWERGGNVDLYMSALDGSNTRRLTTDPVGDELPRCSPDGRELLFRRGGGTSGDLFAIDLETLRERRLTNDSTRDSNPQWSLDGRTVYATKRIDGFDRIVTMRPDGQDLRVVSPQGEWHDVMPAISPDGRMLVHHTYRYSKEVDLQLVNLQTFESRRLTATAGNDYEASFAGNDAVVFSSNRGGGHYRIYRASIAPNSEATLLADTGADAWGPRHSAVTDDVVFYTGKPGAWRLMVVSAQGGPVRSLLDDGSSKSTADWCTAE